MNTTTDRERADHTLTLISRKELKLTGVRQILSFDETSVTLVTSDGELDIDGESLNVDALDLDHGIASVSGNITGMNYINDQPVKKRRFWGGL
jgi:sporulation protein YabP